MNCVRFCFGAVSLFFVFLFVYEIYREPLSRFAPNSHGRRVWSPAGTSLKVKVNGQGYQEQKRHFSAISAACVRSMFGKTSLTCSFIAVIKYWCSMLTSVVRCVFSSRGVAGQGSPSRGPDPPAVTRVTTCEIFADPLRKFSEVVGTTD